MEEELLFHKITLKDQGLFEQYVVPSSTTNCDYSFANVYCWQDTYHSEVAEWGGFLLIRFHREADGLVYMQPVGEGSLPDVIEALKRDAERNGSPLRIIGATKEWSEELERFYPEQFAFSELRAGCDYIYNSEDLATLPGRRYQPKRNHINRFTSRYKWHFEPLSVANIADCVRLNLRWMERKGCCSTPDEIAEQYAMQRAFLEFDSLPLRGGILYADGEPAGFTYGSKVNHNTFCIHIEKADSEIEGASAMINRLFAETLATEFTYLNREEDLGIEGLRYAKMKYHPVRLQEKVSARMVGDREREIRSLWQSVFGDSREVVDTFLERHYNADLSLTEQVDGRVVAMLHIVPMRDSEGLQAAYIYAVATAPQYRGRGCATRLIKRALQIAQERGCDYSFLIPANDSAKALYLRLGFVDSTLPTRFNFEYDFGSGDNSSNLSMLYPIHPKRYPTTEISVIG